MASVTAPETDTVSVVQLSAAVAIYIIDKPPLDEWGDLFVEHLRTLEPAIELQYEAEGPTGTYDNRPFRPYAQYGGLLGLDGYLTVTLSYDPELAEDPNAPEIIRAAVATCVDAAVAGRPAVRDL